MSMIAPPEAPTCRLLRISPPPTCWQWVHAALRRSPYHEVRRLHVEIDQQGTWIAGHVSSYFLKQMAQETVRKGFPNQRIHNQVTVGNLDSLPPQR